MPQDTENKTRNTNDVKKKFTAIMYILVFLTVFVILATAGGTYNNFLGVFIYTLGISIIFLSLILGFAPPEETNRLILVMGFATVLGIIVASWPINIVVILVSIAGYVVANIIYYKFLGKESKPIKA